jgi:hypothetical protein
MHLRALLNTRIECLSRPIGVRTVVVTLLLVFGAPWALLRSTRQPVETLYLGMSRAQAEAILGKPDEELGDGSGVHTYYRGFGRATNGHISPIVSLQFAGGCLVSGHWTTGSKGKEIR